MRAALCIIFSCLLLALWPTHGQTQSLPVQAGVLYPDALHDPEQNVRRYLGHQEQLEFLFTLLNPSETDVSVDQETLLANVRVQVRVDRGLLPVRVEWSDSIRVAQVTRTRAEMERTFILEPSQSVVWVMRLRRTDGLPFNGTFIVETSVGDFATTRLIDGRPSRSANSFAVSSTFEVVVSASPSELAKFHRLRALRASERDDHEQELTWLLEAVNADPSDDRARFGLGVAYLANNRFKEAASVLQALSQQGYRGPENAVARGLAQAHLGLGHEQAAADALRRSGLDADGVEAELRKSRQIVDQRRRRGR